MNSTTTNDGLNTNSGNSAFVPMTESQMESTKAGTDWVEWFIETAEEVGNDVTAIYDHFVAQLVPLDVNNIPWEDLLMEMQNHGFVYPDPNEGDPTLTDDGTW
ncbi:cupin domain-containing protein [Mariniblastus fucicola]|uniref:Uncharacterized protein n=1 Tax=Mariniblastus fucicola TaxID=980251 RepID=A0A5B9P8C8_9BACT|nr:hypothetical protein [Mariniblastus fucicola]QEG21769.1 hypothetical protein MFFC18_16280 [Mariniblastus fucicola]